MSRPISKRRTASRSVLALDLGGTKLAVAQVDADGRIDALESQPTDLSGRQACLDQLVAVVDRARQQDAAAATSLGISIPGLVRRDGTVWAPNLPGWKRIPVASYVSARTGLPVVVESDRNASVLGEAWQGAARGASDAIYLIVGTGIGAGIISGGHLVRGSGELSGCAGWMVVPDGRQGLAALEAVAAGPAIGSAGARAMEVPEATARDVFAAGAAGDVRALKVIAHAAELLGIAVANLVSLFDPEVIVLGGGVGTAGSALLVPLRAAAKRWAQPLAAKRVRIVASRLGGRAPLLGVARLALDL